MNQGFPPARRRGPKNQQQQDFAPVNVVMALLSQSRRRVVTFADMVEKQGMGLVQLKMECQQMAGLLRRDPQGLNRLAIWLQAAGVRLEKNKLHIEEQIQFELFLQGEFQRWLSGEPPSDFASPPPGMIRQQVPPQLQASYSQREEDEEAFDALSMRHPIHGPPSAPQRFAPPGFAPQRMPPSNAALGHTAPQQRSTEPRGEPLLPPPAAFAAYRSHGATPTPEATAHASQQAAAQRIASQAEHQPLTHMPVVRLPVEQFKPAPSSPTNGPAATPTMSLVRGDDDDGESDTPSSSTPS